MVKEDKSLIGERNFLSFLFKKMSNRKNMDKHKTKVSEPSQPDQSNVYPTPVAYVHVSILDVLPTPAADVHVLLQTCLRTRLLMYMVL